MFVMTGFVSSVSHPECSEKATDSQQYLCALLLVIDFGGNVGKCKCSTPTAAVMVGEEHANMEGNTAASESAKRKKEKSPFTGRTEKKSISMHHHFGSDKLRHFTKH